MPIKYNKTENARLDIIDEFELNCHCTGKEYLRNFQQIK